MSKFLSRNSEGWQCVRDTVFNRLVSDIQATKLKYKKFKSASSDFDDEIISEETFQKYEKATIRDESSGFYNLKYFYKNLAKEVKRAKRYKRPFSLMLISVDKMDQLQKLYGNLVICQMLQREAKIIGSSVREVDTVFHISPGQFAIICPETYASKAVVLGQRICDKTKATSVNSGPNAVIITVSVGVASFPTHGRGDKELLALATQFLEQSQNSGGNQVLTN